MADNHESSPEFSLRKKVDESWKEAVEKEKGPSPTTDNQKAPMPESNFAFFISSLGMQALMALGEIAHPETGEPLKADPAQARYVIDTINMLAEKTKGNLTKEEDAMLKSLLYELQMKFVQKSQNVS